MDHSTAFDVAVAGFTFGNTLIGAVVMIRQSRNAARQQSMHTQNQAVAQATARAVTDLKETMIELHK